MTDLKAESLWNDVYKEKFNTLWEPNEDIVRFCARQIQKRVTFDNYTPVRSVRDVLDLGCGNGRHVVYFGKQNLRVSGIDISPQAIEWAREWCARVGVSADLRVCSIDALPYEHGSFDAVVSHGVLDHVPAPLAAAAVKEVFRMLRPGGIFYCDLRSIADDEFGQGEEVACNTFRLKDGYEAGLVQHFFSIEEIDQMFLPYFKKLYVETNERAFGDGLRNRFVRWVVALERTGGSKP